MIWNMIICHRDINENVNMRQIRRRSLLSILNAQTRMSVICKMVNDITRTINIFLNLFPFEISVMNAVHLSLMQSNNIQKPETDNVRWIHYKYQ